MECLLRCSFQQGDRQLVLSRMKNLYRERTAGLSSVYTVPYPLHIQMTGSGGRHLWVCRKQMQALPNAEQAAAIFLLGSVGLFPALDLLKIWTIHRGCLPGDPDSQNKANRKD